MYCEKRKKTLRTTSILTAAIVLLGVGLSACGDEDITTPPPPPPPPSALTGIEAQYKSGGFSFDEAGQIYPDYIVNTGQEVVVDIVTTPTDADMSCSSDGDNLRLNGGSSTTEKQLTITVDGNITNPGIETIKCGGTGSGEPEIAIEIRYQAPNLEEVHRYNPFVAGNIKLDGEIVSDTDVGTEPIECFAKTLPELGAKYCWWVNDVFKFNNAFTFAVFPVPDSEDIVRDVVAIIAVDGFDAKAFFVEIPIIGLYGRQIFTEGEVFEFTEPTDHGELVLGSHGDRLEIKDVSTRVIDLATGTSFQNCYVKEVYMNPGNFGNGGEGKHNMSNCDIAQNGTGEWQFFIDIEAQ